MELIVTGKKWSGTATAIFDLARPDGSALPEWEAGCHIELQLPFGAAPVVRHYSLCGRRADRHSWRIAVLRELAGRGGSAWLCDQVAVGQRLQVNGPLNRFEFVPGQRMLLIAGGIGITPILTMAREAEVRRIDWRLLYLARDRDRMLFLDELSELPADRIGLHASTAAGRLDLRKILSGYGKSDVICACGPQRLLDDLEAIRDEATDSWKLHIERFENPNKVTADGDTAFDLILGRSGRRIAVAATESIIEALAREGVDVTSSCCDGVCATCEQRVLDGLPDHRDAVLSPEEREANETMMICVSRSRTPTLTLDL
jgi:ferredoxin-NADP reductase